VHITSVDRPRYRPFGNADAAGRVADDETI
jgi:hypothetical protein